MSLMEQITFSVMGLGVGTAAGWLHFRSLRIVSDKLVKGEFSAIALQLARVAMLAAGLGRAALGGAWPLIGTARGIMVGRQIVIGRMEAE